MGRSRWKDIQLITTVIAEGYQVVDIGPDGRAQPSRVYEAELEAVRESNHSKMTLKEFSSGESVPEMRSRIKNC